MKKTLLISKLALVFLLFMAMNVSAQEVYFVEGFPSSSLPDGWAAENCAYGDWSSIPNQVVLDEVNGVKMKVGDPVYSWLQMPEVNGVTDLSFWYGVKNADGNLAVKLQSSTDGGVTWTDVAATLNLDLTDTESTVFLEASVAINIEELVSIRIYVYTADGITSGTGALYVDDVTLGKPTAGSNDASLFTLSVDSVAFDGFSPATTSYTMDVSHAMGYSVQATANDPNATVVVTQVVDINGTDAERTATVEVTSADQSVTSTTTIVFTLTDYWYKEGITGSNDFVGWERGSTFIDTTPLESTPNVYPGVGALKFTGGHPGDANAAAKQEAGYAQTPKLINVGTFSFWVAAEVVFPEHELNVYIKTSDTDSTLVKSIKGADLTVEWQEVVVVIEETTDSIQIKIEAICDIDNDGTSRIWTDDFLVTYYEEPVIAADDATLSSLSVGGTEIAGFDPLVTSYTMVLTIIMDETVTAEATDPNATVVITQASNVNGTQAERTAMVEVTSADQSATSTTTIEFNPVTSISDFNSSEVSLYPNPVKDMLYFRSAENAYQSLEIFNMVGQKVMHKMLRSGQKSINVDALQKGIYLLSFTGEAGAYTTKFIKE